MPLSINKLENLLSSKGLIIKKFFQIHNLCVYIEVVNISTATSFMLYIPSKYEIESPDRKNVFKVSYLEIDDNGNIPENYSSEIDTHDIENNYDEINMGSSIDIDGKSDIEKQLRENYNYPVSLQDAKNTETQDLKDIFRQLNRFKFCVQSIKYKICIFYRNYICCIRRDDSLEGFVIKDFKGVEQQKMIITIDLETLYYKIDSISTDVNIVKQNIINILYKNHNKNLINLQKMLEAGKDLTTSSSILEAKKRKYTQYISQLEILLATIGDVEKKNIGKIIQIEEKYNIRTGLQSDIERSHQINKYETELTKVNVIKQELISNIIIIKEKSDHLCLKLDKICFDNTVMINTIIKNFILLSEL
jgi:hypothetical protein